MENLLFLGVPILKHIMVFYESIMCEMSTVVSEVQVSDYIKDNSLVLLSGIH